LCVVAAASADPCCDTDSSWVYYQQLFTGYGATNVNYINVDVDHPQNAYDPLIVNTINNCIGFFFGGGDQTRVMKSFYSNQVNGTFNNRSPSPAISALLERLEATGGLIAGTSAGTDCQTAKTMVTDGDSYHGLLKGTFPFNYSANAPPVVDDSIVTYDPDGGVGSFTYGLLDTHFGERGRQGRMIRLLLDTLHNTNGYFLGFGVDQNTALIVFVDVPSSAEIQGQSGVTICNVKDAIVDTNSQYFNVSNVRCNYATPGDNIDMKTGNIQFAHDKTPLANRETSATPYQSTDIFNSPDNNSPNVSTHEFVLQATSLFNSTTTSSIGYSYENKPVTFAVRMTKDEQSVAYQGLHSFNGTLVSYTSYVGLRIDIYAVNQK
jgi:cyanophycinase